MASSNTPIPVDDGFNEYESALKRQKSTTSKTIFSAKSSSGTSHLRHHLNSCLKKVNKDITQYTIVTQPSLGGVLSIKNDKFDADEYRKAISTFLVCGKHSFRTVEEPGFRYMMSIASLNFKNISRHTAARDVLMYYAKERDRVKEELAKAPGLICLTSDNWNSEYTNDEYICIIAHWVDKDWKLQKRIIRFRALFPLYDGLNIADELVLYLSQCGIDKKIFSITLDNASYNDVMVSCLKNHFRANRAILCDDAFFQVRCYAHILNLIVKAGLELANDVVDPRYKLNYVQYCFTTIYGIHASDFVETILSNLRLLFDEYVKKSKSTSSSLAESSNVWDKNPVDSNLDEHNVNSADFGGDFDESDDYKRYLNESSTRSEKSQLDIYLEEPKLELNSKIDFLDYWRKSSVRYNELSLLARDLLAIPISTVASESTFSMGKKVITPLRSSLKPKTVQAVVCLDDWMRAKGFSTEISSKNNDDDEDDEDNKDDVSSIAF
ncbi:hypothetical protein CXB51_007974 [Gossypium anomalum]|uniref:HAT C-terminal dimerisation domain-containing protein n=1 Tax=Gossypium anomalum TaxID=47600 RepID=A0A8J5ZA28_9ROSI|nr:hypothetical protein CXB51_007974 [Gossypium anomalum]